MSRKRRWIIGIDEVGRGPLAGPVTVALVAAPQISNFQFPILKTIKDSKKLSPRQRREWSIIIKKHFVYSICSISPGIIDKRGIMYATQFAVSKCFQKIIPKLEIENWKLKILLDGGLHAPPEYKNQQTIIKGDELHPIISAASVIAKVHRDRYMTRLAKKFPQYGFDRHKGYGTKAHKEMILKNGLCEHHRTSFCRWLKAK